MSVHSPQLQNLLEQVPRFWKVGRLGSRPEYMAAVPQKRDFFSAVVCLLPLHAQEVKIVSILWALYAWL